MGRTATVVRTELPAGRRVLAVSDIHGNLPFFLALMERVGLTPGDILVLAGKGHERYQLIGNEKHPFNERSMLR